MSAELERWLTRGEVRDPVHGGIAAALTDVLALAMAAQVEGHHGART